MELIYILIDKSFRLCILKQYSAVLEMYLRDSWLGEVQGERHHQDQGFISSPGKYLQSLWSSGLYLKMLGGLVV